MTEHKRQKVTGDSGETTEQRLATELWTQRLHGFATLPAGTLVRRVYQVWDQPPSGPRVKAWEFQSSDDGITWIDERAYTCPALVG